MHIFLITRHYPPEISGGARRPSLYTQALRGLGHRVTLITPFKLDDPDSVTIENRAITRGIRALQNLPADASSENIISLMKVNLRIWVYWPDENIRWIQSVVSTIKQQGIKPDWIMTTSPPESTHIAGRKLSAHFGVPWIAELRDTWIEAPHRIILAKSKFRAFVERRIAKHVLKSATAVTAVSEAVMSEARMYISPGTPECIIDHFSDQPPAPYNFDSSKLNLVHTGGFTLSDRRRTLPPLLKTLDEIHAKWPNMVFHIAGPLSSNEVDMIEKSQTPVKWHGPVELSKARALQAGADGLVLCTPKNSHALPGKYAEYALSGRPVFYTGSGKWLSLVNKSIEIYPLETGFLDPKTITDTRPKRGLTNLEAAKILAEFLKSVASGVRQVK